MNSGKRKAPCQPADDASPSILDLLARCLDDQDPHYEKAWSVLFERVKRALKAQTEHPNIAEDLLSHLQHNGAQALRSFYRSLSGKMAAGEITTEAAQNKWFVNTLRKAARNLRIDQNRKERIPPGEGPREEDLPEHIHGAAIPRGPTRRLGLYSLSLDMPVGDNGTTLGDLISHKDVSGRKAGHKEMKEQHKLKDPAHGMAREEIMARAEVSVRKTLLALPPNLRLALVLKSKWLYDDFGLDDECEAYLAKCSGLAPEEIQRRIREEYASNVDEREGRTAIHPISSKLIASLAGTTADGVDQWFSRARRALRSRRTVSYHHGAG